MTIASAWYDKQAGVQREFEMHFKIARRGTIRNVRRALARRGIPFFQQVIYRGFRRWIPKARVRVSFEREEPASRMEANMTISTRGMQYRGKKWKATPLPSRVLPFVKKKRKSRAAMGKRA
jgi:hypothetical protein